MRVLFVSQGAFAFRMMSGAALQACGDAVTPMKATMVVRAVHITLGPCLAFGWLFFPEMGLSGLAMANAGAQLFGVAMNFYALFNGKSMLHLSLKGFRFDLPLMWQLIKVGLPASAATAERTIAQLVLFGLVARFGDFAVAAFTIVNRTDLLSMMAGMGIGQASGIIAGQCLGAGLPERAKKTVKWALVFSTATHLLVGAVLFTFPEFFASLFSEQEEFLGPTSVWLRIQAVALVFMGINVVLMTTLNNVGDTWVAMFVTLFALWGVQQPLALYLPDQWGLGVYGIGVAMVMAHVCRLAIFVPYFRTDRWLTRNPLHIRTQAG
jgi:putative MATE family efflux protein